MRSKTEMSNDRFPNPERKRRVMDIPASKRRRRAAAWGSDQAPGARALGSQWGRAASFWCLIVALSAPGCSRQLAVRPFQDEFAVHPTVTTTASAEGVHAANLTAAIRVRRHAMREIRPHDGSVTHAPLYFEDPFEEQGSDDGKFAWTGEDYLQMWYWRGRFLVNAVFAPLSLAVTPPWMVMVSDGKPSRTVFGSLHDAEPSVEPVAGVTDDPAPEKGG